MRPVRHVSEKLPTGQGRSALQVSDTGEAIAPTVTRTMNDTIALLCVRHGPSCTDFLHTTDLLRTVIILANTACSVNKIMIVSNTSTNEQTKSRNEHRTEGH